MIAVAAPSRLRRVRLTLQHMQPKLRIFGQHHAPTFDAERARYASKGIDLVEHILGELDRIEKYAALGWLRPEPLPPFIVAAQRKLKQALVPITTSFTGILKNSALSEKDYKRHLRVKHS